MANFKSYFDIGLQAAANTAEVISEINTTFEELNNQISEASNGRILISREKRVSYGDPFASLMAGAGIVGAASRAALKREYTTYIVATNPFADSKNKSDIAEFQIDRKGYPCQIKFGGDNYHCEDKAALERVLSQMLADPDVGKIFAKLINLPTASTPESK